MSGPNPVIGILILNYNGRHWLPALYDSIRADAYPNVRVYLVDNASTDGSVDFTRDGYPEITIVRMPRNLGYCMAYNLAMPLAFADRCEWIIWANNDIIVEPGCVTELAEAIASDSRIAVAGPAFRSWENDTPNYYIVGKHPEVIPAMQSRSHRPIDVDWVEGSFLMVGKNTVERVGPLDPMLFSYWEEADFCRRARWLGQRVVLVPSALARHYGGGTNCTQRHQYRNRWLQSRNYYIYKITNPTSSFAQNLLDAWHLFLVNLGKSSSFRMEIKAFSFVLLRTPSLRKKWSNIRGGVPPFPTTRECATLRPEVIHAAA
jgi:GT2 family glycosyltransferase